VAAWLPGSQGAGVADVLVARRDGHPLRAFTGRLPFAWPADARSPLIAPQFPLGYGLDYGAGGRLGPVNEDPRTDLALFDEHTTFIRRGAVPAPWHLVADGAVQSRPVDLSAQEDARGFSWTGRGKLAVEGPALNLTGQANSGAVLLLDWRIDRRGGAPVRIALGGGALNLGGVIRAAPATAFETRIPLRCFARAGANLTEVGDPLTIEASSGFAVTIRSARIAPARGRLACPPSAR